MGDYFYLMKAAGFKRIRIEGSVVKECGAEQSASLSEEGSCCCSVSQHTYTLGVTQCTQLYMDMHSISRR